MRSLGCLLFLALITLKAAFGQSAPPAITGQPASTTANAGQSVTLSLTATGSPTPTIQWFKDGQAVTGATNTSLTFTSVFGGDAGSYTATVSNVYNGSTYNLTTAPAVLTVITTPPTITTQPVSRTVVAGGNVSFSVAATGSEPMLHRWYRDGVEISGATSSSLSINGVQPSDASSYRVNVTNWANQIKAVSAGANHTMFLNTVGTLWGMGNNGFGQLGDGTQTDRTTPVQVASGVSTVSAGYLHSMFLKTDGTLWGMGRNNSGQLGDGTQTDRTTPVQVASGVSTVSAGGSHTMFLKTDGTLWGMGYNSSGRLGDGTGTDRTTPVQVASGVANVSAGGSHTMFLKTDGTLWGMGGNYSGELGDGSTTQRATPVQVASGVASVSAGGSYTMFLKTDGTLWGMGYNVAGGLGDGTQNSRTTPVQVASGVSTVSAGSSHTMFLKTDGTLWGMGLNMGGPLGDGTQNSRTTPVQVASGVASVSAGSSYTMFLKSDGTLLGMGYNYYGRLGDGTTTSRTTPVRSAVGLFSNAATLTVNTPPVITTQPATQAVTVGFPINLVVVATGNPAPTYQWRKAGSNIPNATNASYTVSSATTGDAGTHTVVVTNSVSSVTSNEAVVTVTPAAPATITVQPTHVAANLGQSATLSVTVSGSPTPSIQWLKNGSAIAGATTTTYAISSVSPADAATYTATVQNVYNGTTYSLTTSPAVLTVIAAPVFTTHPVSRTVLAGTQVALSAAVQGLAATTFQWRKNGAAIGGATGSSYAIAAAATTDSGTYTVVATNGEGSTTSNPAELIVNAVVPPIISGAPASVTIPNGERTQLKVSATGTGTLTFQWYRGQSGTTTEPVSAATTPTFTTPTLTASASYWVRITDGNGAVTNSPTVTVTVSATSPLNVTQQIVGSGYAAGGGVIVTNTITYTGTAPSRIDWSTLLPTGWKFLGSGGSEGGGRPTYKNADLIEWSWTTVPPSPIEFTYTVSVPAGTTDDQVIASLVTSQAAGTNYQTMAKPDPLVIRSASLHSADSNRDGKISLTELTRVIELYNYRSGTTRTGQYKPTAVTEDGFTPGP